MYVTVVNIASRQLCLRKKLELRLTVRKRVSVDLKPWNSIVHNIILIDYNNNNYCFHV